MPELPEVETIVRELSNSSLTGKTIVRAKVFWERTISVLSANDFSLKIKNQKIKAIKRLGKWLVFELSESILYVHLRMTGKFFFSASKDEFYPHERVCLYLNDGRILRFEDQRKFGRWHLVDTASEGPQVGIDPFSKEFTETFLRTILQKHNQAIKPFLLNQKHISGIGNIYVDEALWEAKIHPLRKTNQIKPKESKILFKAIINVLRKGIENTGTTLGNTNANYFSVTGRKGSNQHQLHVFRRNGLPCARCGSIIKKITVAQRGTHICPFCQPKYLFLQKT